MSHEFRPIVDCCKKLYNEVQQEEQAGRDAKVNCLEKFVTGLVHSMCEAFGGGSQVHAIILEALNSFYLNKEGVNPAGEDGQIPGIDLGLQQLQRQILQFQQDAYSKIIQSKELMEKQQDDLVRQKHEWAEFESNVQVEIRQMEDRKSNLEMQLQDLDSLSYVMDEMECKIVDLKQQPAKKLDSMNKKMLDLQSRIKSATTQIMVAYKSVEQQLCADNQSIQSFHRSAESKQEEAQPSPKKSIARFSQLRPKTRQIFRANTQMIGDDHLFEDNSPPLHQSIQDERQILRGDIQQKSFQTQAQKKTTFQEGRSSILQSPSKLETLNLNELNQQLDDQNQKLNNLQPKKFARNSKFNLKAHRRPNYFEAEHFEFGTVQEQDDVQDMEDDEQKMMMQPQRNRIMTERRGPGKITSHRFHDSNSSKQIEIYIAPQKSRKDQLNNTNNSAQNLLFDPSFCAENHKEEEDENDKSFKLD